jgi:hypothetical protein
LNLSILSSSSASSASSSTTTAVPSSSTSATPERHVLNAVRRLLEVVRHTVALAVGSNTSLGVGFGAGLRTSMVTTANDCISFLARISPNTNVLRVCVCLCVSVCVYCS